MKDVNSFDIQSIESLSDKDLENINGGFIFLVPNIMLLVCSGAVAAYTAAMFEAGQQAAK